MRIRTAVILFKEIFYLKKILKTYSSELKYGKYHLFESFRSMVINEKSSRENADCYFNKPTKNPTRKKIVKILNDKEFFANKNKKTAGEYEAFYTANNYEKIREVKLFSFENKKILTVCTCKEEMKKQIYQYETFGKSFPMPKVVPVEKYKNAYEISMVDLKKRPDDIEALKCIARCTIKESDVFNKDNAGLPTKHFLTYSFNERANELLEKMVSKIDKNFLDRKIPLCIQHGDLSKDNLIYGDCDGITDFWYIDWEHAKDRIFFYDYLFYIVNSAMYFDSEALNIYLDGKDDEILKEFFNKFGFEFNPKNKKDYFWIFMVDFLKERVCAYGRIEALEMYAKFFEKYPQLL